MADELCRYVREGGLVLRPKESLVVLRIPEVGESEELFRYTIPDTLFGFPNFEVSITKLELKGAK